MPTPTTTWIENLLLDFSRGPANTLGLPGDEPAWGEPLLGFAAGEDPLWAWFKEDIGPDCLTPAEAFAEAFPGTEATPDELSVITWVLPQTARTRADNRREAVYPSERWARSRTIGQEFNRRLHAHMVEALAQAGVEAVAPQLRPDWQAAHSERYGLSSRWSERHAAHVAGLGTFGLSDGLITPVGKSVRLGSLIARIPLPPTPRPYSHHQAYCTFFTKGTCGRCADRCPAGAITREHGHDKIKCRTYLQEVAQVYSKAHYGIDSYGCGLCQGSVPCEGRIPGNLGQQN